MCTKNSKKLPKNLSEFLLYINCSLDVLEVLQKIKNDLFILLGSLLMFDSNITQKGVQKIKDKELIMYI